MTGPSDHEDEDLWILAMGCRADPPARERSLLPGHPSLLNNMSVAPRSPVRCSIKVSSGTIVRFAIEATEGPNRLWLRPSRARQECLRGAWDRFGLVGAALIFAWSPPRQHEEGSGRGTRILEATNPELVVNVLGRTRSSLLLGNAPLALERSYLRRELASDDPRLVALARSTGARKWSHVAA
ncbi:MAG: hypothetical protein CL910_19570 [Deltaproteobacteria bacterium]|jgi:hypothetical protein|nr:hypothetical protein [Deltaproteobacteria bacterium]